MHIHAQAQTYTQRLCLKDTAFSYQLKVCDNHVIVSIFSFYKYSILKVQKSLKEQDNLEPGWL